MYEVLREIAGRGRAPFNAYGIATAIGRHPSQVQRDLDRLVVIRVIEPVAARGAVKPLRRRATRLARTVVSLPALTADEIGGQEQASREHLAGEP